MSERKEGWYWVSEHIHPRQHWEPAWFDKEGFHVSDRERWGENEFGLVGPRIPSPEEPWQTAPDTANEEMLEEGVESLQRGMNRFSGNHTQIVSNIFEDMLAVAPKPGDDHE